MLAELPPTLAEAERLRLAAQVNKGVAHYHLDNYERAIQCLQAARHRLSEQNCVEIELAILNNLSQCFLRLGDYGEALQFSQEQLQLATRADDLWGQSQGHGQLALVYEKMGDLALALAHQKQFQAVYQQAIGEDHKRQLRDMENAHQAEMAQREATFWREQNERLRQEVKRRTSDLEAACQRQQLLADELAAAESISELRAQIIRTVSHEFRAPLTVINTTTELMARYHDRLTDEKRQRQQLRIKESILYLTDLLQDVELVDLVKNGEILVKLEPWRFAPFCWQMEADLRRQTNQSTRIRYEFVGDEDEQFDTDQHLLKQICANLLTNALKYSEMSDMVDFQLGLIQENLLVAVTDRGDRGAGRRCRTHLRAVCAWQ